MPKKLGRLGNPVVAAPVTVTGNCRAWGVLVLIEDRERGISKLRHQVSWRVGVGSGGMGPQKRWQIHKKLSDFVAIVGAAGLHS